MGSAAAWAARAGRSQAVVRHGWLDRLCWSRVAGAWACRWHDDRRARSSPAASQC